MYLKKENADLRENLMLARQESESYKVSQYYKIENMEKEIQQTVEKNNVLKSKIKKIKKFMLSLSKIVAEARADQTFYQEL